MNIKSKDREIIEKFLLDKGNLLLREDLCKKNLESKEDDAILKVTEKIKNSLFFEHAIFYSLPILLEGDSISHVEIGIYMSFIPAMLEKIGFKDIIKRYVIVFNYFIQDFVDKEGNMLKIGTLRATVLFNKPENIEKEVNNSGINYKWLLNNKDRSNLLDYILFSGYQQLYLTSFYEFITQIKLSVLKQKANERELLMKQILHTVIEHPQVQEFFKNKFKFMKENETKDLLDKIQRKKIDLAPGGILTQREIIHYYKKDFSSHLHRNFQMYSCNFISEEAYADNTSFKGGSFPNGNDPQFVLDQMKEKIMGISMEIDWKYFLSFIYALEDSVLLEAKAKGHVILQGKEHPTPTNQTWFAHKTVFVID